MPRLSSVSSISLAGRSLAVTTSTSVAVSTATIYYYSSSTEYTTSNPNTSWYINFSTTTKKSTNSVSAITNTTSDSDVVIQLPSTFTMPTAPSTGVTLEFYGYIPTSITSDYLRLGGFAALQSISPPSNYIGMMCYSGGFAVLASSSDGIGGHTGAYSGTVTKGQWVHYAMTLDSSSNQACWVNGVYSTSYYTGYKPVAFNYVMLLHPSVYSTLQDICYIDSFRFSNTLLYTGTSNFTPPSSLTTSTSTVFFTKFTKI